jgi:hypothetical protein
VVKSGNIDVASELDTWTTPGQLALLQSGIYPPYSHRIRTSPGLRLRVLKKGYADMNYGSDCTPNIMITI